MISAEAFRRYSAAVSHLSGSAASGVEREILAWCSAHPGSSVAEIRDCGSQVMQRYAQTYDDAAASLAARFYDAAVGSEAHLDAAITATAYEPSKPDEVARYQAK